MDSVLGIQYEGGGECRCGRGVGFKAKAWLDFFKDPCNGHFPFLSMTSRSCAKMFAAFLFLTMPSAVIF